jgi:predicted HicB family RNase H-like nuclease
MAEVKLTVRPSPEMHERLKAAAEREHRSLHGQILAYLERGLAADEARNGSEEGRDEG